MTGSPPEARNAGVPERTSARCSSAPLWDLKRSRKVMCNSHVARVATERIRNRAKGHERFERWEGVPEPEVGGT